MKWLTPTDHCYNCPCPFQLWTTFHRRTNVNGCHWMDYNWDWMLSSSLGSELNCSHSANLWLVWWGWAGSKTYYCCKLIRSFLSQMRKKFHMNKNVYILLKSGCWQIKLKKSVLWNGKTQNDKKRHSKTKKNTFKVFPQFFPCCFKKKEVFVLFFKKLFT